MVSIRSEYSSSRQYLGLVFCYLSRFIGVALTWQVVFIMIVTDVKRSRLLMLPAVLEKLSFGLATVILYAND